MVFASLAPGFLSPFNLFSLGRTLAVDIVIGFAQMVVLATGGMNLAVGAIGVCAVMATGSLIQDARPSVPDRHGRRAGARRMPRLAERLRDRQDRCQQLHHHAGEREPLPWRHADLDQGGAATARCRRKSAPSAG